MHTTYDARLNRAIDYINRHIDEQLDLETIAEVAAFSKYHFHRVFSAAVGEPLGSYIQRLRLERAAALVAEESQNTITEISYNLNFSSPAVFSRAFKDYFGMSPSEWREGGWGEYRKKSNLQSNRYESIDNYRKATQVSNGYDGHIKRHWKVHMQTLQKNLDYTVTVKDIPDKTVAYIRHTGPYAGDELLFERLFGKLMKWAGPRDLFIQGSTELLTIYHDSPDITEEDKLRISVCMTVPKDTCTDGEVGLLSIPAGRYAVAEFRLGVNDYGDAWNSLFGGWLPESGYQCTEGPCYELYLDELSDELSDKQDEKHYVAIHLPVKPL